LSIVYALVASAIDPEAVQCKVAFVVVSEVLFNGIIAYVNCVADTEVIIGKYLVEAIFPDGTSILKLTTGTDVNPAVGNVTVPGVIFLLIDIDFLFPIVTGNTFATVTLVPVIVVFLISIGAAAGIVAILLIFSTILRRVSAVTGSPSFIGVEVISVIFTP
jgi:hypothetical protein